MSTKQNFPSIKDVISFFEVKGRNDQDDMIEEEDEDGFSDKQMQYENMANILLFEVEVGNRTVVFGGFSTNGWVTSLSQDNMNDDS